MKILNKDKEQFNIKSQNRRQGFTLPDTKLNKEDQDFEPDISPSISQMLDYSKIAQERSPDIHIEILSETQKHYKLWVQGGLRIIFYITKFIRQMKSHSRQANFKFLTQNMVYLIGDAASDADELLKKMTQTQKFVVNFKWALNQLPTIDPDSTFKIFWDFFVLIQIVINIFYIPMKLGFGFQSESLLGNVFLNTLPSWTFVADILLNFFTAYYSKGQIHRDKNEIFSNYTRIYFWWDLMIVIPFFLSSFNIQYTEYILLLRVTRVKSMIDSLEEIINPNQKIQTFVQLIKQIFFIMFVSHFCACIWTLIGELEKQNNQMSWLQAKEIAEEDWSTKYIHSLYFSTITTLTVGYGDIVPTTDVERVFVIMMAMVICGVLGYTISQIGEILRQLNEKESQFKLKMMIINNYLKKKQLSKQLQLQVRKYFEYLFKMKQEQNEVGEELMDELPRYLKEQVAIDIYFHMLKKSRLIKTTLSEDSVKKLCSYIHEEKYAPDIIIANQDETADKLYFIQRGCVHLICDNYLRETKLVSIKQSRFIGEREFIIQGRYDYTIKTANFTQVAYIKFDDFLRVIKEDALEEEHFCMIRDSLIFNEDQRNFGQVCFICQWTHQFKSCPLVFLNVNKDKVKNMFLMSENHIRRFYSRSPHKKKVDRTNQREQALAIMVHNNIAQPNDLNDEFLQQLGFTTEDETYTKTFKSSNTFNKSNSNFKDFSREFSSFHQDSVINSQEDLLKESMNFGVAASPRRKMGGLKKQITRESQGARKVVKFQEEPEARNLRSQNAAQTRVFNRKQSQRFSILQASKLSSFNNFNIGALNNNTNNNNISNNNNNSNLTNNNITMETSQRLDTSEIQQIFSKTRTETTPNMISQLQEEMEMVSQKVQEITHEHIDLDIDRQFIATTYFTKYNFDIIISKLLQPLIAPLSQRGNKMKTKLPLLDILKKK